MTDTKLRAKGTGTAEWRNGHWWVKVSLPDKTRPRYRLCGEVCTCESMSEAMKAERCTAVSERERGRVTAELAAVEKSRREKRLTVEQFGKLWTSHELFKTHGEVNALREKASAKDDAYRLGRYVYPVIGSKPVADVTEADIETIMREAQSRARKLKGKPKLRAASRFQLYQCMSRLFDLAIRPGRLRETSPVPDYLRPSKGKPKLFGFLYPTELLALLKCREVPIGRRVLYALAVYTGLRKGSLFALTWGGIDFENGTLTSLQSKTGLPQLFEIPESLQEFLARWFEQCGRPAKTSLVVRGVDVRAEREAEALRDDLKAAGIQREALVGETPADNVERLRFHDLRATFVTWSMRAGKGDGWISDRTGHLTPEMRNRYARAARTLADLKYEPFPSLEKAVPELWELPDNVRSIVTARKRTE
jgi:integrase